MGGVYVFTEKGFIIEYAQNVTGNMHDSTTADWGGVYVKLKQMYFESGGKVVIDFAFSAINVPYLINSSQDKFFGETVSIVMEKGKHRFRTRCGMGN